MTDTPFLDHRALERVMKETTALNSLHVDQEAFDYLFPITEAPRAEGAPNKLGAHFMTADGRVAFVVMFDEVAQEHFGAESINAEEFLGLGLRATHMGLIEQAAIAAQARAVKLLRACETLHEAFTTGGTVNRKELIRISSLLNDIRKEDAARADDVAAMREASGEAKRTNAWVLKALGLV